MNVEELEQVCRATGRGLIPAERRSRWDAFGAVSPDFAMEWWGEKFSSLSLSAGVKIVDSIAAELQAARQVSDDEARYAAYHGLPVRAQRRGGAVEGFIIGGKQSDFPRRDGSLTDAFLLFNPLTGEGAWVGDALEPRLPQTGEGAAFNFAVSAPLTTDPPRGWWADAGDAEIIISDLVPTALRGKKFQRPSQGRTRKGLKTQWYEVGEGRWLPRRWFR